MNHEQDHETEHNDDHPGCANCVSNRANQTNATALFEMLNDAIIECKETVDAWMEANGYTDGLPDPDDLKPDDIPVDVATSILLAERISLAGYWLMGAVAEEIWDAVPFVEAFINFIFDEVAPSVEIADLQAMYDASPEAGSDD